MILVTLPAPPSLGWEAGGVVGSATVAPSVGILTPVLALSEPVAGTVQIDNTNLPDPEATGWQIERNAAIVDEVAGWPTTDQPGGGTHTYRARGFRDV
jgi:hypothetical protein